MKGYTLLECLLTLMLIVILLITGVSAYQHIIVPNKTAVYLNELVTTIYYARSEALKLHLPVTICNSNNGQQCNGNWRDGWMVFIDPHNKMRPESAEQILRLHQALPTGDQLNWRASLSKNSVLQFNALGNARQDGTFVYCPHNHKKYAGAIVVSMTGRVRIERENIDKNICAEIG